MNRKLQSHRYLLPPRACVICHERFKPKTIRTVACENPACQRENDRRYEAERRKGRAA